MELTKEAMEANAELEEAKTKVMMTETDMDEGQQALCEAARAYAQLTKAHQDAFAELGELVLKQAGE